MHLYHTYSTTSDTQKDGNAELTSKAVTQSVTLPTESTLINTKLLKRARSALSRGVICWVRLPREETTLTTAL